MKKYDFENEKILIKLLKSGDESAYKYLYDLYYSELCSYIAGLCGSYDIAEDIVQQTIINFWHKKNKIFIQNSLKKYLYKAVYHQFIDSHRKLIKELDLLNCLKQEVILEIIDIPKDDFEKKNQILELEISRLPNKCRHVFLLGKKEGFKYKEIAIKLNISVKTVEAHMTSALKKLRESIKKKNKFSVLFLNYFRIKDKEFMNLN